MAHANERRWARFLLPGAVIGELVLALWRMAVVGLMAIGASGGVAWLMGLVFGRSFVAGDPPGVTYGAARCAELLEYAPGARTCEQAATIHHFGEVVAYRLAAGVLGVIALVVYAWIRRRITRSPGSLPGGLVPAIGFSMFGVAGVGLVALSVDPVLMARAKGRART
jgi:hypothetical protein